MQFQLWRANCCRMLAVNRKVSSQGRSSPFLSSLGASLATSTVLYLENLTSSSGKYARYPATLKNMQSIIFILFIFHNLAYSILKVFTFVIFVKLAYYENFLTTKNTLITV